MMVDFVGFPKIARLSREVIVSEKIDGTSGTIYIGDDDEFLVGSRTRWITPENDNHGFARWAFDHALELHKGLGPGWHRGEWWGSGIQRGYGLPKGQKRFSLFNTIRWCECDEEPRRIETGDPLIEKYQDRLPACCELVPVLWRGLFSTGEIEATLICLAAEGSQAAPGFKPAEGIVIYHVAGNVAFKKTLGNDGHKGVRS
ncbi:MAG: RNA ligase family protein [Pseudomonadota bacterium]